MPNTNQNTYLYDLLETPSPSFTMDQVKNFVYQNYGLTGELSPLASERDQNFRVRTQSGNQFVIKIANSTENPAIIDMQIKALGHIVSVNPGLPVPGVLLSRSASADRCGPRRWRDRAIRSSRSRRSCQPDTFHGDRFPTATGGCYPVAMPAQP